MISGVKDETFWTLSTHRWHFVQNSVQRWHDSCERNFSHIHNPSISNKKTEKVDFFSGALPFTSLLLIFQSRTEIHAVYLFFEIYAEWIFPVNGALVFDFLCFCDTLRQKKVWEHGQVLMWPMRQWDDDRWRQYHTDTPQSTIIQSDRKSVACVQVKLRLWAFLMERP